MILAKIYLDRDLLIFESAPNEDKNGIYLSLAKNIYDKSGRLRLTEPHTRINGIQNVAISPEAKAILKSRLADRQAFDVDGTGYGDFSFSGVFRASYGDRDSGYFAFRPDSMDAPTKRTLGVNDRFSFGQPSGGAVSIDALDEMTEADNEYLKNLDLSQQTNETA